jgi:hypothetical protein
VAEESQTVGLVGVADERPRSVRHQLGVVASATSGADRGEVDELVAASPTARDEVMHLQAGAALTARPPAVSVTQEHGSDDLRRERCAASAVRDGHAVVDEDRFDRGIRT